MRQLFLDCDGVLANMDAGAAAVFGMGPREFEDKFGTPHFWYRLAHHTDFYANLPVMEGARELIAGVINLGYQPKILTGLPIGKWAEPQKRAWGAKHFPLIEMICCMSKDKRNYMKPGDIIIDDYLKYRHLWVEAGGIFIHHISAVESLAALRMIER